MRILVLVFLTYFLISGTISKANPTPADVCPLCTKFGEITCPSGFEVICTSSDLETLEPRCVFLENKYVPGCQKFIGINKLDFQLAGSKMPSSLMINIIGGGETYSLNREIIGCKKL